MKPDISAQNGRAPGGKGPAKRSIWDDRRVRLAASVVLAVLAWMIITIVVQPGTSVTITNVPVDFSYDTTAYTSRGLSIVRAPAASVTLNIQGDGYTIGSLARDDFVVYPDYSSVRSSGEKNLRLLARCTTPAANSITVTIAGQNTVDVTFDVVQERTVAIQAVNQNVTVERDHILLSTTPSAATVTLSGPSGELDRVASCVAEVYCDQKLSSTHTVTTNLRYYDQNGSEIFFEYTTADIESVDVTLVVYKLATLPISVSFINTPPGFDASVLRYDLSRSELNVAGPENVVDALGELSVGAIDLSTFTLDGVYEMPVQLPSGIVSQDNVSSITVSFDCSALATKTLNLPAECVQVVNLPATYQLTVQTERLLNVQLCGPASALESLTVEQVVAQIDAEDFPVVLGQQNIACQIYVPSHNQIFALGSYAVQCEIQSN